MRIPANLYWNILEPKWCTAERLLLARTSHRLSITRHYLYRLYELHWVFTGVLAGVFTGVFRRVLTDIPTAVITEVLSGMFRTDRSIDRSHYRNPHRISHRSTRRSIHRRTDKTSFLFAWLKAFPAWLACYLMVFSRTSQNPCRYQQILIATHVLHSWWISVSKG